MDSDDEGVVVGMESWEEEDGMIEGRLVWVAAGAKALYVFWVGARI